jgi:hypothetical protein
VILGLHGRGVVHYWEGGQVCWGGREEGIGDGGADLGFVPLVWVMEMRRVCVETIIGVWIFQE